MSQHLSQANPTLEVISSTQLQRNIGETLRRVFKDKQHLIVERDGLPVLVMLPVAVMKRSGAGPRATPRKVDSILW